MRPFEVPFLILSLLMNDVQILDMTCQVAQKGPASDPEDMTGTEKNS